MVQFINHLFARGAREGDSCCAVAGRVQGRAAGGDIPPGGDSGRREGREMLSKADFGKLAKDPNSGARQRLVARMWVLCKDAVPGAPGWVPTLGLCHLTVPWGALHQPHAPHVLQLSRKQVGSGRCSHSACPRRVTGHG